MSARADHVHDFHTSTRPRRFGGVTEDAIQMGSGAMAVGRRAVAHGPDAWAFGEDATAVGAGALAIGKGTTAIGAGVVTLGPDALDWLLDNFGEMDAPLQQVLRTRLPADWMTKLGGGA